MLRLGSARGYRFLNPTCVFLGCFFWLFLLVAFLVGFWVGFLVGFLVVFLTVVLAVFLFVCFVVFGCCLFFFVVCWLFVCCFWLFFACFLVVGWLLFGVGLTEILRGGLKGQQPLQQKGGGVLGGSSPPGKTLKTNQKHKKNKRTNVEQASKKIRNLGTPCHNSK